MSRYGAIAEMAAMLQFCEVLADYDAFNCVIELFYDSKSGICKIATDPDTPRGGRIEKTILTAAALTLPAYEAFDTLGCGPQFRMGDYVKKKSGSQWSGIVCGFYSTGLTPQGYCVESDSHKGSVQIYPETALEHVVHDINDKPPVDERPTPARQP